MATVTFDTLDLVDKPKSAGIAQEQADAVIRVIAEAQGTLVTKEYLYNKFDNKLSPIYTALAVLKWMMGVMLAGTISLVLKAFF